MIKLSVVIITYNEEKLIGQCLDAAKVVADEILVVDSFSTDRTEEICRSYGARFIANRFEGHIQQKNFAAAQASFDHVLSLDADEVLSPELTKSILEVKQKFTADGFSFNRFTNYCGHWVKHCGWYPDRKLRLWDRRKGTWGGENPHDEYKMEPGSKIEHLKGDLLHYSYFTIQQHIAQMNKFTDIGAKARFEKGKKSSLVKIIVFPLWKFIRDYVIKLGFLDGYYGFVICMINAHGTFIKYVKIKELQK